MSAVYAIRAVRVLSTGSPTGPRGWDGFILLECEDGFPCLILPPENGTRKG